MGESTHQRQTVREGGQHCYAPSDCEARFRLLERSTKELSETVFGGPRSLPTRVTLLEESVPNIEKALEEIKTKLDARSGQRAQIAVAVITSVSAIVCAMLMLFGGPQRDQKPYERPPAQTAPYERAPETPR